MNVLVVCHGNINRSPACAAVLKCYDGVFDVLSAGFVNPGKPAAKKMREATVDWAVNLDNHRSQLINPQLVEWADVIILMDGGNHKRFTEAFPDYLAKVVMLGEYADPPVGRIPDPNYLPKGDPRLGEIVELIVTATRNFITRSYS